MNHRRMLGTMGTVGAAAIALAVATVACSSSSSGGNSVGNDAGTGGSADCYKSPSDTISGTNADGTMGTLKSFTPPCDTGPNTFVYSASGEANAIIGYAYPPYDLSTATYMIDGWNWNIDRYIVVIDHITLWTNPNTSTSNQELHGPQIAHIDGPFVIDLHKGGPLDGKGGAGEQALPFAAMINQNDNGGAPFDPSTVYAFGFSTVQATYNAINVNLTKDEEADFQYMVANGGSVYYHGTTTWAGDQAGGQMGFGLCSSNPQTDYANGAQTCATATGGSGDGGTGGDDGGVASCPMIYDFSKLPQTMSFQFAFPTPTNYVNCVNYSVSELVGHDVRGVQTSSSQSVINQVTVHMDHPFWESFEEDTPVHWNQIAAQYIGQTNPTAHLDDFKGVAFSPFQDKNKATMPWQWCENTYTPPGEGAMSFDTLSVPIDANGTCTGTIGQDFTKANCPAIRDYYDYIRYTQSTQGHLNSQGLCYIDRQYPAPAGGS